MTLFLMIFLVFIETVMVYSTPKLKFSNVLKGEEIEHDQFSKPIQNDTSSSDEYLSNDLVVTYLRNEKHVSGQPGAEGYIFDEKLCKLIKKRILCGYDRNKGEISEEGPVAIGKNCVIRNDRIECGYTNKPFSNSLHLRFKTVTNTKISSATMSNETKSTENQEQNNIRENSKTNTEVPIQLLVLNTSETLYSPKTSETNSKEIKTAVHQLTIAEDNILVNSSLPVNSSNNVSTITTVKNYNLTTLPSSVTILSKNITTSKVELLNNPDKLINETRKENINKTESVRPGLISKLMNKIDNKKQVRSEKHIESIPPSKNCNCPFQASNGPLSSSSAKLFLSGRRKSKSLRKSNSKINIQTSCVENQDRIVCLDFKVV